MTSPAPPQSQTFEDAVRRLTEIIEKLERGDLPLEESIADGKGAEPERQPPSAASQARLDAAEKRVEELLHIDAGGNPRTAPFGAPDE